MRDKKMYSGLDWLKIIAALLVVANHTGPFSTYSKEADFFFSGMLSRVAVPIFFYLCRISIVPQVYRGYTI